MRDFVNGVIALICLGFLLMLLGMFATAPSHVQSEIADQLLNPNENQSRHTHGTCIKCKELDVDLIDGQCINCWWPTK